MTHRKGSMVLFLISLVAISCYPAASPIKYDIEVLKNPETGKIESSKRIATADGVLVFIESVFFDEDGHSVVGSSERFFFGSTQIYKVYTSGVGIGRESYANPQFYVSEEDHDGDGMPEVITLYEAPNQKTFLEFTRSKDRKLMVTTFNEEPVKTE